jgi:hypothetical protein
MLALEFPASVFVFVGDELEISTEDNDAIDYIWIVKRIDGEKRVLIVDHYPQDGTNDKIKDFQIPFSFWPPEQRPKVREVDVGTLRTNPNLAFRLRRNPNDTDPQ